MKKPSSDERQNSHKRYEVPTCNHSLAWMFEGKKATLREVPLEEKTNTNPFIATYIPLALIHHVLYLYCYKGHICKDQLIIAYM